MRSTINAARFAAANHHAIATARRKCPSGPSGTVPVQRPAQEHRQRQEENGSDRRGSLPYGQQPCRDCAKNEYRKNKGKHAVA
jgi:hypothetical protein